jgi:prepilin-type N-terminal cleavage/methylation domain-containing protein
MIMNKISNTRGFTLVEMLIAATISVIVISSALGVYLIQHKHLIVQDQISDMQQNIRASMQELSTKIRMAGYNVPVGINALNAFNTNPDTIEIIYDSDLLGEVQIEHDMPQPSAELRCDGHDLTPLHDGDWVFIYDPNPPPIGEFFEITQVQYDASHIQHNTMSLLKAYPAGSKIIKMNKIKYYVDNTTDPQHPRLMVKYVGQSPQIYADNVTDLQFRYLLSSGVVVDVPSLVNMVREVIIDITARTDKPDDEFITQYRTRGLQTSVKVRNLAIN